MSGHHTKWEFVVSCESCGVIGHCSSFEEVEDMRARHEEQGLVGAAVRQTDSQVLVVCNQQVESSGAMALQGKGRNHGVRASSE